jgi:hypothetical protein
VSAARPRNATEALEWRLNEWEWEQINSHDRRPITLEECRAVLGYVLPMYGVSAIPHVRYVSRREYHKWVSGAVAYVERGTETITVQDHERFTTAMLLHEAAHVLTECPLRQMELLPPMERATHGPLFYSNYLSLLDQTMGKYVPALSKPRLMASLGAAFPGFLTNWYPTVRGVPLPGL